MDRGWPEIICCPIDEVAASSKEFGSKVYKAVHDAGVRTYATKNPLAADADAYRSYVDVWCSQPYSTKYEKVMSDKRHEYWSYPNHNAGERKNRSVMCKGGRMTYGFGFWRSGYTTLIPWHWSWTMSPDPFDYLRTSRSGCGQRIDDSGGVIPAVYWECFREGYDDARYLFTLQQAAWERVGSTDPQCRRLVADARHRLQEIWSAIEPQERYLSQDLWPSSEFNARRWQIAMMIQRLLQYPAQRRGVAPSVYVANTAPRRAPDPSIVDPAEAQGRVESLDLGEDFSQWKSETPESSIRVLASGDRSTADPAPATLRWNVKIDHHSGGTADGKYKVGWPRVRRVFQQRAVDLTAYDFLEVTLRVDSDRDEVQDDVTMLGMSFSTHEVPRLFELKRDLGDRQRESIRLQLSIPEIIHACDKGTGPWKSLAHLQLFISESDYSHGTSLQFDIEEVRLLRFKDPMISALDAPNIIMLPRPSLQLPFKLMGTNSVGNESHRLTVSLVDDAGRRRAQADVDLASGRNVVLDTSKLTSGFYQLETEISTTNGRSCYESSRRITCIDGPATE